MDLNVDSATAGAHRCPAPSISGALALLFAIACGLAVANVYYAQPLLDTLADTFGIRPATVGAVVTITQVGYGLGLLLVVPLGDLIDRRRLIVGQLLLSVVALLCVALAPRAAILLPAMATVGVLAVVTQVLVAYAASMAPPGERGRMVSTVTSGIILGILLARAVSGSLSDLFGWRAVYLASAAATLVVSGLLWMALPRHARPATGMSYLQLIRSVFTLFAQEPVLRVRSVLAMLIFMAITMMLTPMVLPLTAPPFSLSHTQVGLFGLAGVAGVLGAARAGRQSDRGRAQRITGIGLTAMLLSWALIALLPWSIWAMVAGVVMIDFGLQSVHVANQSLIYRVRPEAQSRLTGGYMIFYSIGSATGSMASTMVYAHAGWNGVCAAGALVSGLALVFWTVTRHLTPQDSEP
ncbi:MFS transporter [Variovorax sp. EL159]|uniref:MFS transporter n=1 Tax=Variovorax sp. EL159 TaxID=1566270 RepID=UPI00088D31EE|nr:MFS transporter [Variovorax sp. EL159]SCX62083.1 Predicted arabinose efflux permease, MFS family [Variovorax sp. EL159]